MRTPTRVGAVCAVAAAAVFTAPSAHATAPGDNGTVKIHDASTGEELRRNEPHVCTFYLDAFGFDGGQQVSWHIDSWAPTAGVKGETVKSGSIALDGAGHGRTEDLSLPDGHYKLFWNFAGEKSKAAKHKVFWTDCSSSEGGTGPSASASSSAPASASASAGSSSSAAASASASASASAGGVAPSASPSPQGGAGGGDLAETGNGVPVGVLSGAAAALVAGGGFLVLRRRKAARG
ncbi:LPXTG cell wall anchor domain-containing protein [Streptomyces sp. NBC_00557]|uniref:LPXTG cell wall anchor domain-containing protein n=1 Tax=Streptomyces sp. NBC_00557 TaxID=2975776 RepID=UPI002E8123DC|nr:LPXTG cell wall anchor domain-containing protein [Streptomyces sp. NBC_00557]WUC36500.1 LPXTG cell wall anchor domain-containing protein [Streptomyces sp. NBC_00557]